MNHILTPLRKNPTMSTTVEDQPQPQADAPAVEDIPPPKTAEQPAEQPEATAEDSVKEKKAPKEKKQRTPREKKSKTPAHPPYFQMIKEAITALNEKGGSSPYAIAKYMEENHKPVLPSNFRKILGLQLKNSVSRGKLVKIKASYKLSEAGKTKESSTTATTRSRSKTKAARANAGAKDKDGSVVSKRKKPKSRAVSKIESPAAALVPAVGANTRRRSKRAAPAKPKQLKSIKKPKKAAA